MQDWEATRKGQDYTVTEMILIAKCARHERTPKGMTEAIASQYGRTPRSVTQRISSMRKSGSYKNWLEAEKQIHLRL